MKKKILGIVVLGMLISTSISVGETANFDHDVGVSKKISNITGSLYLHEDFSGEFPPQGWETDYWKKSDTNKAGGTPPEARINKYDQYYGGSLYDNYIMAPKIDANDYECIKLEFKFATDTDYPYNCYFYVKYRRDLNSPWQDLTPWVNPLEQYGSDDYLILIYSETGFGNEFQVIWEYNGYYYYYNNFYLDDVIISGWNQEPDDLIAIDVNLIQTIEDADDFIINKKTVACVNIMSTFSTQQFVDIRVIYNFGKDYIETGPNGNGVPIQPGLNRVYIPGGPVFHELDQTKAWINSGVGPWLIWTSPGIDNLSAYVNWNNSIFESVLFNNECLTNGTFFDSIGFRVLVARVFFPDGPLELDKTFNLNMGNQKEYISGIYPVSEKRFDYDTMPALPIPGYPPLHLLWTNLKEWLYNTVVTVYVKYAELYDYDRVVIVLHQDWKSWVYMPNATAIGIGRDPMDRIPIVALNKKIENLIAHEIGHTYWLWHPHEFGPPVYDCDKYDVLNRDYEKNARTFMSYEKILPYGVPIYPIWIDKGRYYSNPLELREFIDKEGTKYYMDSYNLFDQFTNPLLTKIGGDEQEVIIIAGIIHKNGTILPVDPWYRITNGNPDLYPNTEGDYFIVLLDNEYNILSKSGFNVSFKDWIDNKEEDIYQIDVNSTAFVFSVPYVTGLKYIELWDSNNSVALSITVTPHSPTVEVLDPNGGETIIIGEEYTITWDADDIDDDPLVYEISYSIDGEKWKPLDFHKTENQCIWNTSNLIPGYNYTVRVMACDGVNTGIDESDYTFTVQNLPPDPPVIDGPSKGGVGVDHNFTFVAMDSNNHSLYYYVDWGDDSFEEWIGPYDSGKEVLFNHKWNDSDFYTIRAKVKDIFDAESEWAEIKIKIPRNKPIVNSLFQLFFERFPLLERLLTLFKVI